VDNVKKFLENIAKAVVILAIALLASSASIQAYGLPPLLQYVLILSVSIVLYSLLVKMKFSSKIAMLGALTAYLSIFYVATRLVQGTILETLKAFIKGEKLSIFVEGVLKHITTPIELSYYTLTIIALWTAFITALLLLSASIVHYFSHSWFFLENLIPPLSKPLSKYLLGMREFSKFSSVLGVAMAVVIFSVDIVLSPEIPSLILLFTNVSFNISMIIFSVIQISLTGTLSEHSHFSLMAGAQIGLIVFLILLNVIFWKRGITKKFIPLKERLRIFSVIILSFSITYISLYLLTDMGTLTLFPYIILMVFFNSILAARIESEFQVLFIADKLNISMYRFLSSLVGLENLREISALAVPILYLTSNPVLPAILANIMGIISTYEKREREKAVNPVLYLPTILFMFFLFSALFLPKYGGEIYEVESFIPEIAIAGLDALYMVFGAAISIVLGVLHLLAFKYPLNPVAFIVSYLIESYNSILAMALATALKIACLKILKPKEYFSAMIIAILAYIALSVAYIAFSIQ